MRTIGFLVTFLVVITAIFVVACGLVIGIVVLGDPYFASIPEEVAFPVMWIVACLVWIFFSLIAFFKLRRRFFPIADKETAAKSTGA